MTMNVGRIFWLAVLAGGITVGLFAPAAVHAAQPAQQTERCAAVVPAVAWRIGDLNEVDCGQPRVLRLYENVGFSGNQICFAGTGCVNLTDYPMVMFLGITWKSWNDQVSSYEANLDEPVKFYWDINMGGDVSYLAAPLGQGAGDLPPKWNDEVSSICIGWQFV
jgi:hypothetical protein